MLQTALISAEYIFFKYWFYLVLFEMWSEKGHSPHQIYFLKVTKLLYQIIPVKKLFKKCDF